MLRRFDSEYYQTLSRNYGSLAWSYGYNKPDLSYEMSSTKATFAFMPDLGVMREGKDRFSN
jgi:hypothetical protein